MEMKIRSQETLLSGSLKFMSIMLSKGSECSSVYYSVRIRCNLSPRGVCRGTSVLDSIVGIII